MEHATQSRHWATASGISIFTSMPSRKVISSGRQKVMLSFIPVTIVCSSDASPLIVTGNILRTRNVSAADEAAENTANEKRRNAFSAVNIVLFIKITFQRISQEEVSAGL